MVCLALKDCLELMVLLAFQLKETEEKTDSLDCLVFKEFKVSLDLKEKKVWQENQDLLREDLQDLMDFMVLMEFLEDKELEEILVKEEIKGILETQVLFLLQVLQEKKVYLDLQENLVCQELQVSMEDQDRKDIEEITVAFVLQDSMDQKESQETMEGLVNMD